MQHQIPFAEGKARDLRFVGAELPAQRLAVESLAALQIGHLCEHIENTRLRHWISFRGRDPTLPPPCRACATPTNFVEKTSTGARRARSKRRRPLRQQSRYILRRR